MAKKEYTLPLYKDKKCTESTKQLLALESVYTGEKGTTQYYIKNESPHFSMVNFTHNLAESVLKEVKISLPKQIRPNGIGVVVVEWKPSIKRSKPLDLELAIESETKIEVN